ncbi:MAG: glycosyltransferase family 39 protein [Candidatus Omnitrophica bacterium]|nr:glycosyltransferase family 39 protein [Candidatus Omnitrophota bacterium]MDD5671565.1 glycosyltransferase family 39 protein [Candidatus Omnitrophota bacterium]
MAIKIRKPDCLALLLIAVFLVAGLLALHQYGIVFDSPKNFDEGKTNLNFLLTRKTPPLMDQIMISFQIHGALFFMAADGMARIWNERFHLLGPIEARHLILPVLSAFLAGWLYTFLKRYRGAGTALLAIAFFLTYPRFIGHTFNNIKDIPLLAFFSLALMSFYDWVKTGRWRNLYTFFAALGATACIKSYAVIIPVILGIWFLLLTVRAWPAKDEHFRNAVLLRIKSMKFVLHCAAGAALVLIMIALLYMPVIWGLPDVQGYLASKWSFFKGIALREKPIWNIYSLTQIFYVTPVVMLAFAALGFVRVLLKRKKEALDLLWIVWFLVPVLLPCTPFFNVYGGIRLFFVFLIPFSVFTALGVLWLAGEAAKIFKTGKKYPALVLSALLFGTNLAGIVSTHPYEDTFFNALAGGLKGAQTKGIPFAYDYWLSSYREAMRWINANAHPKAMVWTIHAEGLDLLDYYDLRKDLRRWYIVKLPLPSNSYVIFPEVPALPGFDAGRKTQLLRNLKTATKVYRISRQGAVILTIYYKP